MPKRDMHPFLTNYFYVNFFK